MISDKYKLETLLKRKRGVPFEKLEEQMQIYSFELKLFIINYVIEKMSEFNFQTPRKNNIHLKKVFLYLNKEDDNLTREQKEELIKRLMELKNTVDILLGNAIIKTENADLNEAMLVELLNDVQYTILNLECDYDKNKMFAKLKGMGNELYDLLEYVIFNNNDISIFKLLVNVDIFLNADRNKEIVLKVLDKYFNTFYNGNDYDQLYYQAVLEEFLLSGKKYLTDDDVVSILNSLTRFSKKEQIVLENEDNLLRLIKDLENGNLKKKDLQIFKLKYEIDEHFPYDVEAELSKLQEPNLEEYTDLTDKKILSIDSESTCLKENAFTIDFMNEGYLLTLYVPAITEFLSKNSSLEKTAYNRGISVVKSDLFPRKFLYSKCSFEANKDRLALAYKFYLNKDLNLDKVEASKVVINVDKNLSKKDTARLLQASADDWVAEQVQYLNALSHALSDATSRNYFVAKSLKNDLNFRLQSEAFKNGRNIVDNLTIYSNAQMANYFLDRGLPFIYRNNEFNNDNILFDQVKKENTNTELLTLLEKLKVDSYFSAKNKGHNGLRKQAYGQISIPCRSYAAYVCQKLIIKFLIEKEELTEEDKRCLNSELEKIAGHLNNRSKINAEYLHERAKVYQYRRGI